MSARIVRTLIGAALLAVGVTAGASAAGAASGTQIVSGSGLAGIGNGLNAFHVEFRASKTAEGVVGGRFSATGRLTAGGVDIPLPVTVAGPVTCLTVRGSTAAFVYPLTAVRPALVAPLLRGTSIEITVTEGSGDRPGKIGFFGPVPTALLTSCAPQAALFTVQGTVSVDDGGR